MDASDLAPTSSRLRGRILLADDGVHNQQVIAFYLTEAGAEVTLADNGHIACQTATAAMARGEPFDAILMDMQMPGMDGYAATAAIRAAGFCGPIIAVTGHAMRNQHQRCIECGCSACVPKPIDREVLIAAVATALVGGEVQDDPHVCVPGAITPGNTLRSMAVNDPDLAPFLPAFVADLPGVVARISALLDAGNIEELAASIHQIKGNGGIFGFAPLTEAAVRAEAALTESGQIQSITHEVQSLIDLVRTVEGYEPSRERQFVKGETE
jgi:CheY-like chemotaxis protein/HPt (histidine-containing phosphotransfer) domain-containing protein